jgi:Zn-dependent protease with chaperone function/tetratricopeptide (TPR) repeat protein
MDAKGNHQINLNPFALPLETDILFVLNIVAGVLLMLGLSVAIASPYIFVTATVLEDYADTVVYALEDNSPADKAEEVIQNFLQAYEKNMPRFFIAAISPVVLTLIILAASYFFYQRTSARIIQRKNLSPLKRSDDSKLYDMVSHLAAEIDLDVPPKAYIDNTNMGSNSQVWRNSKGYNVSFGLGSRMLLRKKADFLKAIILHEFAHIVNRDVFYTYFSQSLWWIIAWITGLSLVIALGAYGLFALYPNQLQEFLPSSSNGLQTQPFYEYLQGEGLPWLQYAAAGLALIMFVLPTFSLFIVISFVRVQLLRVRELYADSRAGNWGVADELKEIFKKRPEQKRSILRKIFALHPTNEIRQEYLKDSNKFFHFSYSTSVITGFLITFIIFAAVFTGLVYRYASLAIRDLNHAFNLLQGLSNPALRSFLGGKGLFPIVELVFSFLVFLLPILFLLLVAYLITEVGGISVQRKVILNEIISQRPWREQVELGGYASSFAVGAAIAIVLMSLPVMAVVGLPLIRGVLGLVLLLLPFVTAIIWIILYYIQRFSRLMFTEYEGVLSPGHMGRSIRTSALLLTIMMAIGLVLPPVTLLGRGIADLSIALYLDPANTEILDSAHSGRELLLDEPTLSMSNLPISPDLLNFFWNYFPSATSVIIVTAFCFVLVIALFFVLTHKMLQADIRLAKLCPQCNSELTSHSWLSQKCLNCGFASGRWTLPEHRDQRRYLMGVSYLEKAYDLNGRHKFKHALSTSKAASKYVINKSEVFNLQGLIYGKMGEREEARRAFSHALAQSAHYKPAAQNLVKLDRIPVEEAKPHSRKLPWKKVKKPADQSGQKSNGRDLLSIQTIGFLFLIYICSWVFPKMMEDVSVIFSSLFFIVIVFSGASYLIGKRLSDYASPGKIVIGLLIAQLIRYALTILLAGSLLSLLLDLMGVLALIIAILWLIFLPGIPAFLASILATIYVLVYQIAFLVIFHSILPGFSLAWLIDPLLSGTIVFFSLAGCQGYMLKVASRQYLETLI